MGFLFFNTGCTQKYFGKSYPSTKIFDEYYDNSDVEKSCIIMGKTDLGQAFRSLEKTPKKIIDLAGQKGADGVIFSIEEKVYRTSNSSSGSISNKKDNKITISSSSNTLD